MPIAAASIGQVYKARLPDGRDVAVKVQYPGVASAVRADMQNLGMILRLMKRNRARGSTPGARRRDPPRIDEELDYELEAAQPAHARADLPRAPVHRRARGRDAGCRARRWVVWEYDTGPRLRGDQAAARRPSATGSARSSSGSTSAACTATTSSAATRTRATRCCSTTGGMAFLDFGLFKRIPRERSRSSSSTCSALGGEGRAVRAESSIWAAGGLLGDPTVTTPDKLLCASSWTPPGGT